MCHVGKIYSGILHLVVAVDARNLERLPATKIRSTPIDMAKLSVAVVDVIAASGPGQGHLAAAGSDLGIVVGAACQPIDFVARYLLVYIAPEKELAAAGSLVGLFVSVPTNTEWVCPY